MIMIIKWLKRKVQSQLCLLNCWKPSKLNVDCCKKQKMQLVTDQASTDVLPQLFFIGTSVVCPRIYRPYSDEITGKKLGIVGAVN